MLIIDTGPLVALFDPQDPDFPGCQKIMATLREPLYATEAVLTEAFHILDPNSRGAHGLMQFILEELVTIVGLRKNDIGRSFELMDQYSDCPMDFADATLIVIAENLKIKSVFTLDVNDFSAYKIKRGHRSYAVDIISPRPC
jgi:predicted nucleic acid-binding protein